MAKTGQNFPVCFTTGFPIIILGKWKHLQFDDSGSLTIQEDRLLFQGTNSNVNIPKSSIRSLKIFPYAQALWKSTISLIEILLLYGVLLYLGISKVVSWYQIEHQSLWSLLLMIALIVICLLVFHLVAGAIFNAGGNPILQIVFLDGTVEKKCSFLVGNKTNPSTWIGAEYKTLETKKLYKELQGFIANN
jgi:glucan phosphoethanolaminetransferase (alkaline phosphatase superfamily)